MRVILLYTICVTSACGDHVVRSAIRDPGDGGDFQISGSGTRDVGEIEWGSMIDEHFMVVNLSSSPISLLPAIRECGCQEVEFSDGTIAPYGSIDVNVRIMPAIPGKNTRGVALVTEDRQLVARCDVAYTLLARKQEPVMAVRPSRVEVGALQATELARVQVDLLHDSMMNISRDALRVEPGAQIAVLELGEGVADQVDGVPVTRTPVFMEFMAPGAAGSFSLPQQLRIDGNRNATAQFVIAGSVDDFVGPQRVDVFLGELREAKLIVQELDLALRGHDTASIDSAMTVKVSRGGSWLGAEVASNKIILKGLRPEGSKGPLLGQVQVFGLDYPVSVVVAGS